MKENEMLLKNRRSDSNLFRQKSDCDCTLKTFKKTFLFHQFELFFSPLNPKNLVIQQLNYSA